MKLYDRRLPHWYNQDLPFIYRNIISDIKVLKGLAKLSCIDKSVRDDVLCNN